MIRSALFACAALASLPAIAQTNPLPTPTPSASTTSQSVQQMEHISVVTIGHGRPVMLIPGLSSPRAMWDGVAGDLAKTHRVYLVQVNGFGGDAPRANAKPGILDGVVADLHTLIVRDKLVDAAVVGHSMGGLIAMKLADRHPADAGRLMIVDSLPFIGVLFDPAATATSIEPRAARMRTRMANTLKTSPSGNQASTRIMSITPEGRAKVAAWFAKADAQVSAQAMYEDFVTDLRPNMAKIATPITMLYPWSTAGVPEAVAARLYGTAYATAPNVTLVPIAESYHFIMLDQPAKFAAALNAFLQR